MSQFVAHLRPTGMHDVRVDPVVHKLVKKRLSGEREEYIECLPLSAASTSRGQAKLEFSI